MPVTNECLVRDSLLKMECQPGGDVTGILYGGFFASEALRFALLAGDAAKKVNDCSAPVPWPCDNEDLASFPIQLINRNDAPLGRLGSNFFGQRIPG